MRDMRYVLFVEYADGSSEIVVHNEDGTTVSPTLSEESTRDLMSKWMQFVTSYTAPWSPE